MLDPRKYISKDRITGYTVMYIHGIRCSFKLSDKHSLVKTNEEAFDYYYNLIMNRDMPLPINFKPDAEGIILLRKYLYEC